MENNIPGKRTTLCINEAFYFLESPEYGISESTSPPLIPDINVMKRAVSDSGIKESNHIHNGVSVHMQDKLKDLKQHCTPQEGDISDENSNLRSDLLEENLSNSSVHENKDKAIEEQSKIPAINEIENIFETPAKGDNQFECQSKGNNEGSECLKGDNLSADLITNNSLVVPKIEDCDSGCDRSSSELVDDETDIPKTSDKISGQSSNLSNYINDRANDAKCDVVTEKSDCRTGHESNADDGNSKILPDDNDDVVRLRPKSVTSPEHRRGTTQIVSDAFCFLKEIDDSDETNSRRSSGYRSLNFPDETSTTSLNSNKSHETVDNIDTGETVLCKQINDVSSKDNSNLNQEVNKEKVKIMKRQKSMEEDQNSDDSSDEDTGIYNESYRNSCWICVDNHHPVMQESIDEEDENQDDESKTDDVFIENQSPSIMNGKLNGLVSSHKRSASTTTTASESEFKRSYQTRRKCFVQRNDSQQEYERTSRRVFDNEKIVTLEKNKGETGFGLHILDTHPVVVSGVDKGSPASRAGIKEGQILLMVNGVSVLEATHDRIISLVQENSKTLQVEVANTDIQYVRDLQKPVISGYLHKQKNSTFLRSWKKRYCVLRQDNCLYYYKTQGDLDPLGAIPMLNYTVSRHQDSSKEHCFKADKYGAKTYYFSVDSREEMARWVGAMNEASMMSKKRKESWMDVTSHNVGLPALEVRKAECSGYLWKCRRTTKTWQKRYCILKDACIYYYKNMNSSQAQGMAHLHGYTISDSSKKFSFTLKPPETQMKPFTFAAENETDKKRWVEALSKSIQRWIKVD